MTPTQPRPDTVAVVGAGPYGLSVAAHLLARNVPTAVYGEPMESWRLMPARMNLKSVWSASSLSDPADAFSLERYCAEANTATVEPIPLGFYLDYAQWFQERAVPDVDRVRIARLGLAGRRFRLELSDGRALDAARVVVAVGVRQFPYVPPFAAGLPSRLASHTGDHVDLSRFRDSRVAVVGGGQSALEVAAMLAEEGAQVELIVRGPVFWIKRALYMRGGPMRHLLYPPSDVGPPGLNWLCGAPLMMRRLPAGLRGRIEKRAVRPAGAQWLRPRVDGRIPITAHTEVVLVNQRSDGLRLRLSDGSTREVDHLMLGTGYRPDVSQVPFLDPDLRRRIRVQDGFPALNQWFESSIPGLHFVGGLAGHTFGPICRFVSGARAAAQQVTRRAAESN
jgi:cation diffusion facilitator CzcD-associated flavoprotein CzcO